MPIDHEKLKVGEKIRGLRKNKQLTQVDLCKKLGIPVATLSSYETGKNFPSPENLKKIAEYFEVTFEHLIERPFYIDLSSNFTKDPIFRKQIQEKIEKDAEYVKKVITNIIEMIFSSKPTDEKTFFIIMLAIEKAIDKATEKLKEKYTPIKYFTKDEE